MAGLGKMITGGILAGVGILASLYPPTSFLGLAITGGGTTLFMTGYNEKQTQENYDKAEKKALGQTNLQAKMDFVGMLGQAATGSTFLRAGIRKIKGQSEQFSKFGLEGSRYKSAKVVEDLSSRRSPQFYGNKAA